MQTAHICRFVGQLHARCLGGARWRASCRLGAGFYRWLGLRGVVTQNPVDGIRAPKSPKALPKLLSPDEANRLLTTAKEDVLSIRDQAMFELFTPPACVWPSSPRRTKARSLSDDAAPVSGCA